MNLNELTECLKDANVILWSIYSTTEDVPFLGAYILPNLSDGKYPEYEQDYAELVEKVKRLDSDDVSWRYKEDEKGIVRIGDVIGEQEFGDGIFDNGAFEEIGDITDIASKELTDYLLKIEKIFSLINDFNKKVCQKCGKDYASYNSDCFQEELFLVADCEKGKCMLGMNVEFMNDDDGLYNGRLSFEVFENGIESTDGIMVYYFGGENDVTIPEYIKIIQSQAFRNADVEKISIPDGIKCSVSKYAFEDCESLKYVYFGSGVELPEGYYDDGNLYDGPDTIFYGCDALECIEVSSDNPYISSEDGKLYNKDKTKLLYDPTDKSWWEEE